MSPFDEHDDGFPADTSSDADDGRALSAREDADSADLEGFDDPDLRRAEEAVATDAGRGWLARLWDRLRHPIWIEGRNYKARRRCRAMIAMPFAGIAGLAWGVLAAPSLAGSVALWGPLGAFAFIFFIYLEQRMLPPLAEVVTRAFPAFGAIAGLAWETLVVGALFFMLTSVIGAPLVPAVGTALGLGAFYAVAMEYVLCGSAASDVALLLQGGAAGSGARLRNPLSHADTLLHRGRRDEAIAIYHDAIDYDSRDPKPYIRLSRVYEGEGQYETMLDVLRLALRRAELAPDQEAFVVRRIYEISASKFEDPALAAEELEHLIERQRRTEHATWARWRLKEIREKASDDR